MINGDKINIIVHPGYLCNHEGYNLKIYEKQIAEAKFNIFLHPQLSKTEKVILHKKHYGLFMKEIKSAKTWETVLSDYEEFKNNNKLIFFGIAAYYIRNVVFTRLRRKYKSKIRSKDIVRRIANLKYKTIDLVIKYDLTKFKNDCISDKNKEYRENLENLYPKHIGDRIHNLHLNGTLLNSFDHTLKLIKNDNLLEDNDEIFLFGENYNQCVLNTSKVLDKYDFKYNIITELTSYNHDGDIETFPYKKENNHFFEFNHA